MKARARRRCLGAGRRVGRLTASGVALGLLLAAGACESAAAAAPSDESDETAGIRRRAAGQEPPPESKVRISLAPERGYYDDAWALDPTGKRLALIRTDRDAFQRVEIFDLESPNAETASTFDLPPPARAFEGLSFLPRGAGLLLTSGGPPDSDSHVAETIDVAGKKLGKTAPATGFGTASRGGQTVLVRFERRPGKEGQTTYVVGALKLPALKPSGPARSYAIGGDGALRAPAVVPIAFFDGYSKLLARRPGWYDPKRDARQPDAQSVVDLLSGKVISTEPIEDVYGWARSTPLPWQHPNRTAFVLMAEAFGGHNEIDLLDTAGKVTPLPLAVPFRLYDRTTLKDQEGPEPGRIYFSVQVDPVNVDAVVRKKADVPYLDIYCVGAEHPESNRLCARVPIDARPVAWSAAGGRLVVLRKFRSFARGGDGVDVYDLSL